MNRSRSALVLVLSLPLLWAFACNSGRTSSAVQPSDPPRAIAPPVATTADAGPAEPEAAGRRRSPRVYRVVHVFVALCDNKYQGIVPVPAAIGNGQDPENNLYWAVTYGVRSFFKHSPHWKEIAGIADPNVRSVMRRAVFKSRQLDPPVYVVADAYDGAFMKDTLTDFFDAASGEEESDLDADGQTLHAGGLADLVAFVGHNGLMDMSLSAVPMKRRSAGAGDRPSASVVLACMTDRYFTAPLAGVGCPPLITTAQLMAPEAYSLDAIIRSWAIGDKPEITRQKAGDAFAKYQRLSVGRGRGVFVAGPGGM
jgi:hypothetical protein